MSVFNLTLDYSILETFLSQIRNTSIHQDRMRFRRNLERIGEIMAYEISKKLPIHSEEIQTPLAKMQVRELSHQPVLATILRAGLPLHAGFLNYFDVADCGFITAYRHHIEQGFEIRVEYLASPNIEGKTLILIDPMLATGQSIVSCLTQLLKLGKPQSIYIASVLATETGIQTIQQAFPNVHIYCAAIDQGLNDQQYIVPGLGDAGDLCFGDKISAN